MFHETIHKSVFFPVTLLKKHVLLKLEIQILLKTENHGSYINACMQIYADKFWRNV